MMQPHWNPFSPHFHPNNTLSLYCWQHYGFRSYKAKVDGHKIFPLQVTLELASFAESQSKVLLLLSLLLQEQCVAGGLSKRFRRYGGEVLTHISQWVVHCHQALTQHTLQVHIFQGKGDAF